MTAEQKANDLFYQRETMRKWNEKRAESEKAAFDKFWKLKDTFRKSKIKNHE